MPIKIPDSLPARAILEDENIFVMTEHRAILQDIRPLELLILNLMPTKIVTETQLHAQALQLPPPGAGGAAADRQLRPPAHRRRIT